MSMVRFSLKLCPFAMTTGMSREAVNDLPIVHAMWQMIRDQRQQPDSPSGVETVEAVEAPSAWADHDDSDGEPPAQEQARNVRRRVAEPTVRTFEFPPPPVDVSKLPRPPPPPAPWQSAWAPSAPSAPSSAPAAKPSSSATPPSETELVSRVMAEVLAQIQRGAPNP